MNDQRYTSQSHRGRTLWLILAVLAVAAAMLYFTLTIEQPVLRVVPGKITQTETQLAAGVFLLDVKTDEQPAICGFALLAETGENHSTAAVFRPEADGWLVTGKPPRSAQAVDAIVPYALQGDTLYIGEALPAEAYAQAAATSIQSTWGETAAGEPLLTLELALDGLDPGETYLAGFLTGKTTSDLHPFGDMVTIHGADSHLLTAAQPLPTGDSPPVCVVYLYPLSGNVIILADQAVIPGPEATPTPTATPAPTATPTLTPTATPAPTVAPTATTTLAPTATPTAVPTAAPTATALILPTATATPETPGITPEHAIFHLFDLGTRYYFHQLTDAEKAVFAALYDGIMAFEAEIEIPACTEEELDNAVFVLRYDCPELFQTTQAYRKFYREPDTYFRVSPEYLLDAAQYEADFDALVQIVDNMQTAADFGSTQLSRELSIYRTILNSTTYSLDLPYCDRTYAPLLLGYAKCDGYAKALSFSLRYWGIPCAEICGDAVDEDDPTAAPEHGWNYVSIDGQWYQCDITWDDGAAGGAGEQVEFLPFCNLTDERMLKSRTIWPLFAAWELPVCDSTDAYFYRDTGVMIGPGDDFSATFDAALTQAYTQQEDTVIFIFARDAEFQAALLSIEADAQRWQSGGARLRSFSYLYSTEGLAICLCDTAYTR